MSEKHGDKKRSNSSASKGFNTSVFDGLQREFQDEELQIEDGGADGDKEAEATARLIHFPTDEEMDCSSDSDSDSDSENERDSAVTSSPTSMQCGLSLFPTSLCTRMILRSQLLIKHVTTFVY